METDLAPGDTFNKKIRNAQLGQWNYILGVCVCVCVCVCGEGKCESGEVLYI